MTTSPGEYWGDPRELPVEQPTDGFVGPAEVLVIHMKRDILHMLPVVKCPWVKRVRLYASDAWNDDDRRAARIINDYLWGDDRDLLMCQDKLIEVGLERYARL